MGGEKKKTDEDEEEMEERTSNARMVEVPRAKDGVSKHGRGHHDSVGDEGDRVEPAGQVTLGEDTQPAYNADDECYEREGDEQGGGLDVT